MNQTFSNISLLLTAFGSPGPVNNGVFLITFLFYCITIFANLTLILVIYLDSSLHKPMYMFLLNLAVNGLIGCSTVWPKVMDNLLKDIKDISLEGCLIQVFFINVYATCCYAALTVMAYDRYVSICKPLQYHNIMTPSKVKILIAGIYVIPISIFSFQVYITSKLPLCRYSINKLFCDNLAVVKLACVKSGLSNVYGICTIASLVVLPFLLVMLSYIKILLVSLKSSKESQKKALNTCAPHLITFINFSLAILFSVVYNRHSSVSKEINIFMSVQFVIFPPLLHPFIYGIRTKEIKKALTKIFRRHILACSLDLPHLISKPNLVWITG